MNETEQTMPHAEQLPAEQPLIAEPIRQKFKMLGDDYRRRIAYIDDPKRKQREVYRNCSIVTGTGASGHFTYDCGYNSARGGSHDHIPYWVHLCGEELEAAEVWQRSATKELRQKTIQDIKALQKEARQAIQNAISRRQEISQEIKDVRQMLVEMRQILYEITQAR